MNDKADYFDITKLYSVLEANGWNEGKNFMKYWADGTTAVAAVDSAKKKSTIGVNANKGLRIYRVKWSWLNKYSSANKKLKELSSRLNNQAAKKLLIHKYGKPKGPRVITTFNDWLVDGFAPSGYLRYVKDHQLQYIAVNPYEMNGNKFDDLVASLNGFNFFAFYKGKVINAAEFRKDKKSSSTHSPAKDSLADIPAKVRKEVESHLNNPLVKSIVYVTHVGIYAGDIYEFNGKQYLATWNLKKKTVELSKWDYLWGTSDTDDEEDLAITNETFQIYRKKTGKGGDFLALSPIKLIPYSLILPVK